MGLAASQARLLTITARLADNELRSQTINNAKMRLATQSSKASEDYVNALNNATMKFTNYALDGESQTQNLTFNALTAYSSYNNQYGLVNSSGQLLVSETEAALFEKANGNLNSYLQYHGLTYETTYFENVGAITNEGYIEPFNYISVEDMKTYFEEYNSYENSQEVEDYSNAYNEYISKSGSLENASKIIMADFFTTGNSPKITKQGSNYKMEFATEDFGEMIRQLQNAFNDSSNSYSFENIIIKTTAQNIQDSQTKPGETPPPNPLDKYREALNNIQINGNSYTDTSDVELSVTTDAENGTTIYSFDGITLTVGTTDNLIKEIDYPKDSEGKPDGIRLSNTAPGMLLKDYLNTLKVEWLEDDGSGNEVVIETTTYTVKEEADGSYSLDSTSEIPIPEDKAGKEELISEIVNEIILGMISEFAIPFAETVCSGDPAIAVIAGLHGVDPTQPVGGSTMTLEQYYTEYKNASTDFFGTIFAAGSVAHVQADIKARVASNMKDEAGNPVEISYRDFTDVDFVLRYMAAEGLQPSETFLTVIKEFVVDQIIDEYGTPKYAWVDSTDPDNTGNADAKAQWYTNLFKRMQQGYKALENGLASSAEWIEYALESGIVTMEQVDSTYTWQGLDYKACSRITEETDDAAVTKAEAEYSRTMNDIEAKDNIYDLELKNIDTEHSSLQTEYESIKNVISKNIERTFNFYKNA